MDFWNFPAVTGGNINSINNASLETFRDNALDSLTREICQNSLDAVMDSDKPVIVEFHKFSSLTDDFPDLGEMVDVFNKCHDTWEGKNIKGEEFIEQALSILKRKKMNFLRVSDFNTLGLKGAKEGKLGSPWSSLVKEAGSSNKGDESGGSFGIGKAAPLVNSQLRTLFYSSFDDTGFQSHIGVADIMSFEKGNNQITVGKGYYTKDEQSRAIEGLFNLDPDFTREETGTDIYITAFEPVGDYQTEMVNSVLHNFFITVFQKKLIVRINDIEINHENIEELIYKLEDNEENRLLKNYFRLFVSDQTIKVKYPVQQYKNGIQFEDGEATLYLMNGDDLNRRILMTRKTGMRLFEQKNINGSISFTGVLMITGSNMNSIFKQLENPAHNGWSPSRYEKDVKLAAKIYADLRKFMRDTVKELFQQQLTDVMDAVGVSDFLPDSTLISQDGKDKVESVTTTVKEVAIKKKEQKPKKKMRKRKEEHSDIDQELLEEFGITPEETDSSDDSKGGPKDEQAPNERNPDEQGEQEKKKQKRGKSKPVSSKQKYICSNKQSGQYNFLITTDKKVQRGQLTFKLLGEQSDYDLPIRNAKFNDESIMIEDISANTIHFVCTEKKKNLSLSIEVDYTDYCVMEVGVFEN